MSEQHAILYGSEQVASYLFINTRATWKVLNSTVLEELRLVLNLDQTVIALITRSEPARRKKLPYIYIYIHIKFYFMSFYYL